MYKARNGFTLHNADTASGWTIRSAEDIATALLERPDFQTVATGILWEAIEQAAADRKEYTDINDLADHITAHHI